MNLENTVIRWHHTLYGPTFLEYYFEMVHLIMIRFITFLKDRYKGGIFDLPSQIIRSGEYKANLLSSMFLRDARFPFWSLENSSYFH